MVIVNVVPAEIEARPIADAPMTHFYGQKVGADTSHHDSAHPSQLHLHERPRDPSNNGETA